MENGDTPMPLAPSSSKQIRSLFDDTDFKAEIAQRPSSTVVDRPTCTGDSDVSSINRDDWDGPSSSFLESDAGTRGTKRRRSEDAASPPRGSLPAPMSSSKAPTTDRLLPAFARQCKIASRSRLRTKPERPRHLPKLTPTPVPTERIFQEPQAFTDDRYGYSGDSSAPHSPLQPAAPAPIGQFGANARSQLSPFGSSRPAAPQPWKTARVNPYLPASLRNPPADPDSFASVMTALPEIMTSLHGTYEQLIRDLAVRVNEQETRVRVLERENAALRRHGGNLVEASTVRKRNGVSETGALKH